MEFCGREPMDILGGGAGESKSKRSFALELGLKQPKKQKTRFWMFFVDFPILSFFLGSIRLSGSWSSFVFFRHFNTLMAKTNGNHL